MKQLLKTAAVAAFVLVPFQAHAVTDNVIFNGTVTHTCTIAVNSGGTMVADGGFQNLGSTIGAGVAGDATISATGNTFQVSIDTPNSFDTQPAADTTGETFTGSFVATGATSASGAAAGGANSGGSTLNAGNTDVSVDLVAAKSGTDVFEAGAYQATVVLRCE